MTDKKILKEWKKKDIVHHLGSVVKGMLTISKTQSQIVGVMGKHADITGRLIDNERDMKTSIHELDERISKLERKEEQCKATIV